MRRIIKAFYNNILKYLLWLTLSTIVWMWIYSLTTDVKWEKKVVLYLDVPRLEQTELSIRLEEQLPEGIRMIRARQFNYALFDDGTLEHGDLYVVPAADAETYLKDFAPITPEWDCEYWYHDGAAYGVKIYDAATDSGPAADLIGYRADSDYYLFFGALSPHMGEHDGAAFEVARTLLALP